MVLQIIKWDVHPEKVESYAEWAKEVIPRLLKVPGLVEFRGYRPVTGSSQVVTTFEFKDLAGWATWYGQEEVQKIMNERREFTINETSELWGPSPLVPDPIRPGP